MSNKLLRKDWKAFQNVRAFRLGNHILWLAYFLTCFNGTLWLCRHRAGHLYSHSLTRCTRVMLFNAINARKRHQRSRQRRLYTSQSDSDVIIASSMVGELAQLLSITVSTVLHLHRLFCAHHLHG